MKNKDQRSFLLSFVLGDGCLAYTSNRTSGTLTIDHGLEQRDYVEWKAKFISEITSRNVKVRQGHKNKSCQIAVCMKKLKAWRKFCYPDGKKRIERILPFINNPEFAVAVWLMDDGYVEPSRHVGPDGDYVNRGARFRIFTNSEPLANHPGFVKWFEVNMGVTPNIKQHYNTKADKTYPLLKFSQADSLVIWEKIRNFVLQFDSMKYKFRYIEQIYLEKLAQRTPQS